MIKSVSVASLWFTPGSLVSSIFKANYHDITEILLNSFKMLSHGTIFCPVSNKDAVQRGQMPKCPQSLDFPFYFDTMLDFFSVLMIQLSSDCQMEIRCLPIFNCSTFVFTQYKFVKGLSNGKSYCMTKMFN